MKQMAGKPFRTGYARTMEAAIEQALRLMVKINQTAYIYATYKGIAISPLSPPCTQGHIIVRGDGTVTRNPAGKDHS